VDRVEAQYVLRRIRPGRRDASLLAKALTIYHSNTPHLEATATNEIQYWSERYNSEFTDQLYLFVLETDGQVIGFAECVHFTAKQFVILDYMSIDETKKSVGVFFIFYELIREFFVQNSIHYDFLVAELLKTNDTEFTESSELWKALMALEQFRLLDAEYAQLQLGQTKYDTQTPARLMIGVESGVESLRRETYLMLVQTIVTDHYVRWYAPFQNEEEKREYQAEADRQLGVIKTALATKDRVQLSALPAVVLPTGSIRSTYASNSKFIAIETVSYVVLLAALISSKYFLNTSVMDLLLLAVGALFVRMAILAVFVPEANNPLRMSIEALGTLLGKKHPIAGESSKKPANKRKSVK
jgi:hypothetical protein